MTKRHGRSSPRHTPSELLSLPAPDLFGALADRELRDASGLAAIEGVRFLMMAARTRRDVHAILHSPVLLRNGDARRVIRRLKGQGVPVHELTPEAFRALSSARRASGVAAIVRQRWTPPEQLTRPKAGLWLGVRHLQSKGNLGTILRAIDATGAAGLVCIGKTVDPWEPDVLRASMGAMMSVALVRTTHSELARLAARSSLRILGASAHAATPLWSCALGARPTVALVGHERHGLTEEEESLCDELVTIPMSGEVSSLNAGVAAGLVLYEALRQRHASS